MVAPKPAELRQRRNKTSTQSTLVREHDVTPPELPDRGYPWHPFTVQWWYDVWSSPMAPEFEKTSDAHGLFMLAQLRDDFWSQPPEKARARAELATEIRMQEQRYGLSPYDRRRLQWTVEQAEEAQDRGRRRRAKTIEHVDPSNDPRAVLYSSAS